jgi:hypothetical protein
MCYLLRHGTIEKGKIQTKCIWGRQDGKNVLIPEGSDEYNDSLVKTEKLSKSVSAKDVKIGFVVRLKNGSVARYLGKSKITYFSKYEGPRAGPTTTKKPTHFFERVDEKDLNSIGSIFTRSKVDAVEILSNKEASYDLTRYCAGKYISTNIKDAGYGEVYIVSDGKDIELEIELIEVPQKKKKYYKGQFDSVDGVSVLSTDSRLVTWRQVKYDEEFPCKIKDNGNRYAIPFEPKIGDIIKLEEFQPRWDIPKRDKYSYNYSQSYDYVVESFGIMMMLVYNGERIALTKKDWEDDEDV